MQACTQRPRFTNHKHNSNFKLIKIKLWTILHKIQQRFTHEGYNIYALIYTVHMLNISTYKSLIFESYWRVSNWDPSGAAMTERKKNNTSTYTYNLHQTNAKSILSQSHLHYVMTDGVKFKNKQNIWLDSKIQ